MEAETLMNNYNITIDLYHRLYQQFLNHCQVAYKPELSLQQWVAWVCPDYLFPHMATILFVAATDAFKSVWRFMDFAEFALIYGSGNLEVKTNSIITAFIKYAILSHTRKNESNTWTSEASASTDAWIVESKNPDFDLWLSEALSYMIYLLCQTVEVDPCPQDYSSPQDYYPDDEEEIIDQSLFRGSLDETRNPTSTAIGASEKQRRRSYSLNLSSEPTARTSAAFKHSLFHQNSTSSAAALSKQPSVDERSSPTANSLLSIEFTVSEKEFKATVPEAIQTSLKMIYESPVQAAESYVHLIRQHHSLLPGIRDLSIAASCLFGVEPISPVDEKEFITELTLRYLKLYPPSQQRPYGPIGTEWYLIPRSWIDSWRMFVGKNRSEYNDSSQFPTISGSSSSLIGRGTAGISAQQAAQNLRKSPFSPGMIDNWSIIKKSGAKALLPGLLLGQDFEVIPPAVYAAFSCWYGGGPAISRRVILSGSTSTSEVTEIEFYPLSLVIVECDRHGKVAGQPREMLFSKALTILEMIQELSLDRRLEPTKIRLWNYAKSHWKEQYILSPELNLTQANLQEGQLILLETSQSDGSWPRSQLHAFLDNEEKQQQQQHTSEQEETESEVEETADISAEKNQSQLSQQAVASSTKSVIVRRNSGLVGMDNLGNTCYLNSSLQALLHTDLLIEYFLSQTYLKDINIHNKHGFGGRIANIFGKLVLDLWTTNRDCITPRYVYNEIAALRDQFAGNEQHDAHELLAFLLDGLSEDLNLVHSKPYTIQPDSDGRDDEELANIWWENHLKRDRSVIQALFTGQFKSIMNCSCGYSSARFEPFNFLTVPIPEDTFRVMILIVVPRKLKDTARVAVRIQKNGIVEDIVEQVRSLGIEGIASSEAIGNVPLLSSLEPQYFVAGELVNSRIKSFINLDRKLDTIRDNELLVIFHVTALPKKMDKYYAKFKQQQPPLQTDYEYTDSKNKATFYEEDANSVASKEQQSTPSPVHNGLHNVRIAFSQRRINYVEGAYCGVAGFDFFRLEPFGMPILEVLPNKVKASDLYKLMERRLSGYYKGSVREFVKDQHRLKANATYLNLPPTSSLSSSNMNEKEQMINPAINGNNTKQPKRETVQSVFTIGNAAADVQVEIRSISTEEVVAGPIPSKGFTLRLITGGTGATVCCSRCPWIDRCQGCILPDSEEVEYDLLDGESIAVDWHYVIFEDLLDTQMASTLVTHPSIAHEKAFLHDTKVPLSKCLDKFNEQESLEGVICPKCHEENNLKKTFMLWRLPPVLIVQLKRFQFDRTSRRKLNNRIDFPLADLDLLNYIAPTKLKRKLLQTPTNYHNHDNNNNVDNVPSVNVHNESPTSPIEGSPTADIEIAHHLDSLADQDQIIEGMESHKIASLTANLSAGIENQNTQESLCTSYDLYSVIHHIGALGGGHYVTTVRFDNHQKQSSPSNNSNSTDQRAPSKTQRRGAKPLQGLTSTTIESADSSHTNSQSSETDRVEDNQANYRWYTFNDNIVSEVTDLSEINSPSAYVLFYIRKDIHNSHDIDRLLRTQLLMQSPHSTESNGTNGNGNGNSSNQTGKSLQTNVKPKKSIPEDHAKQSADGQHPPTTPTRRNEYILTKKIRLPSKKQQNVQSNDDSSPRNAEHPTSSTSTPESDNNCRIS